MTIEEFKKAKIDAMKAKDKDAVNGLNTLISKLTLAQIEKRAKGENLSDADYVSILQKCEKELNEEKELYEKANRIENVKALEGQIAAVKKFLPTLLGKDEIKKIIMAMPDKSIGSVMKKFKTEYAGKVDMRMVNEVLKTL